MFGMGMTPSVSVSYHVELLHNMRLNDWVAL